MWSSEARQGLAVCMEKEVPSLFCRYLFLSIGPAPEIEPATSVKCTTDCANPDAVYSQMLLYDCENLGWGSTLVRDRVIKGQRGSKMATSILTPWNHEISSVST